MARVVTKHEVLWSVLKGHGGCASGPQGTARQVRALSQSLDFQDAAVQTALEAIARSNTGALACPLVHPILNGTPRFESETRHAVDFLDARSINAPHARFRDLALASLALHRRGSALHPVFAAAFAQNIGAPLGQGSAWAEDPDPNDFQRTVWQRRGAEWEIVEGVNRSTAIAASLLDGWLSAGVEIAIYRVV